ncbi:hypothetical protein P6F46_09605 [Bacillus shihchuchen]|uniref:Uncharacterized protein n=1 Tax=Bacillus shihchuchen TaxID=3036942 RepID=A0ABT7KU99_9BACI|nr:hypothetical protein [Bacillus shihchuchen]
MMKLMQANLEIFEDKIIKPSNYLIERVGNQYILHREVAQYEIEAFREEKLFQYKGRSFCQILNGFLQRSKLEKLYALIGQRLVN